MSNFFTAGGFGMYPTTLFGLILVVVAAIHAFKPRRALEPLIIGAGVATLLAGALGTAMGIQASANGLEGLVGDQKWAFAIGIGESLNCLVLGLVLAIVATLLATAGSFRLARAST
jgi:uncharacterized membrane protein